jgi:hypothetical protein
MGSDDDFVDDLPDLSYTSQSRKKPQKFHPPISKKPMSTLKKTFFDIPANKFLLKVRVVLTLRII